MTELRELVKPILAEIAREEPFERIERAKRLREEIKALESDAANLRRTGVRELRAAGWTLKEIAAEIGTSWQRVRQIEIGD